MPLPEALIALATLGTAHSPAELPPAPTSVKGLLEQVDGPPEAQILLLAGALSLQEKAGRQPLEAEQPLPPPSEPDERPAVSPAAAQHLIHMVAGEHKEVLPEWLATAHDRGLRPPHELLPYLLDLGLKQAKLRSLLFPLLGPRAVWLAEQAGMGPWAYFRLDDVETVWQEAETAVRVALLAHLRWRDPARGRDLLASTWRSEGARQRETFLRELDQGLGPEDESFLEEALEDRAVAVRQEATSRLARLPGSAFNERMIERATALLSLQRSWRGTRLSLNEGALKPDASWQRDRLGMAVPAELQLRDAEWVLQQLLRYVAPRYWQRLWKLEPAELVAVARRAPVEFGFLPGLTHAAHRAGDQAFILLLIRDALPDPKDEPPPLPLWMLLSGLSTAQVEGALLPWVRRGREVLTSQNPVIPALLAHRQLWGRELAAAVIAAVSETLHPANVSPSPRMAALLEHVALHAPPYDGPALVTGLKAQNRPELQKGWKKVADEMLATLDYRRRMLKAFEV